VWQTEQDAVITYVNPRMIVSATDVTEGNVLLRTADGEQWWIDDPGHLWDALAVLESREALPVRK
jgi:hypothetical protein